MKKHTIYGVLIIIVTLVFCLSVAPSATAASAEEEVLQVMSNWFKAFNTNDYELMSSIHWHSPETSFFGPRINYSFLVNGWDRIAEVFKSAFENPVGTFSISSHNPQVTMLDDNVAVVTMYAIFTNNPPVVDEQQIMQQRGTLVVKKIKGKWQVVHLHWSILPTE
jgi:uncharacterized protein (TIGR02246 family)